MKSSKIPQPAKERTEERSDRAIQKHYMSKRQVSHTHFETIRSLLSQGEYITYVVDSSRTSGTTKWVHIRQIHGRKPGVVIQPMAQDSLAAGCWKDA